jgi:RNA polymerase sigma-70 factor (ECF subfamily)
MADQQWLAERFAEHRPRLKAVAYRMLGSLSEADDAVQDAWLRISCSETGEVENLGGWLTTIVARIALNMRRSRTSRREEPLEPHLPDPIIDPAERIDPEHQALLADSVGLALLVVLDALTPAERLAFVLHDTFAVPFEQIGPMIDRSPAAARQLASRARRRVRGRVPAPDAGPVAQWRVVDAFLAAARDGDFARLVAVLDPDVLLRADGGHPSLTREVRGAEAVAGQAVTWTRPDVTTRRVLVNGVPGFTATKRGRSLSAGAFTVRHEKIVAVDILADPQRLAQLELAATEN